MGRNFTMPNTHDVTIFLDQPKQGRQRYSNLSSVLMVRLHCAPYSFSLPISIIIPHNSASTLFRNEQQPFFIFSSLREFSLH